MRRSLDVRASYQKIGRATLCWRHIERQIGTTQEGMSCSHGHWALGLLAATMALLYLFVCIVAVNDIPSSLRRAIPAFTCGPGAALNANGVRRFTPRKALIYQAADTLYWPQLQATHALHSAYAAAQNYTLVITDSPEPGLPAGRVNLNRIWRTIAEVAADQYDVLVWLDSDAVIVTRQPIELITRGSAAIHVCHSGSTRADWDVNDGVLFFELRHPRLPELMCTWQRRATHELWRRTTLADRLATPVIDAVRRWKGMAKRKKADAKPPWVSSQDLLHSVLYDVMMAAPTRAADAWRAQEGHGGGAFKTYRSVDCPFNGPNGRHVSHALVEPRHKQAMVHKMVRNAGKK